MNEEIVMETITPIIKNTLNPLKPNDGRRSPPGCLRSLLVLKASMVGATR